MTRQKQTSVAVSCVAILAGLAGAQAPGGDVVLSEINDTSNYGAVGGIRGYAIGSNTCNIGTANIGWISNGSPGLAMNAYRVTNSRIEQIGQSFAKTACCAAAGGGCGLSCNGQGGSVLGAGCLDVYSSGWNGGQGRLGPRSVINPNTGSYGTFAGGSGNAIWRRLQIAQTDLQTAGARYFIEGVYVGTDDCVTPGAPYNNATYKRVTINANFDLTVTGAAQVGKTGLQAWRDHGLGVGVVDPGVILGTVDVPGEAPAAAPGNLGRFHYGYKVTQVNATTWHYEYAIYNLNSDRAGGSLSLPVAPGVLLTNVGFKDVPTHSGEPYDNTDWGAGVLAGTLTWKTPQTFAQNANSNALRWGTMYNFWFDANVAPGTMTATLGLFKPGTTDSVAFPVQGPVLPCVTDANADGIVDQGDVDYVVNVIAGGANPTGLNADYNRDGSLDQGDVDVMINIVAGAPCP